MANAQLDVTTESQTKQKKEIVKTVRSMTLESFPSEWDKLKELSDETEIDGIETDPIGVTVDQGQFNGVLAVHVVLNFRENSDTIVESNSILGKFRGHFDGNHSPVIDSVDLDLRPLEA